MNAIEKLLKLDVKKIALPTREVELKRLSDLLGEPVVFKLQGVSSDDMESIREMSMKGDDFDMGEIRLGTVVAGVKEPNLREGSLLAHYDVVTPYDLIKKLLLPGEIDKLYTVISELSGFDDTLIVEIKN